MDRTMVERSGKWTKEVVHYVYHFVEDSEPSSSQTKGTIGGPKVQYMENVLVFLYQVGNRFTGNFSNMWSRIVL